MRFEDLKFKNHRDYPVFDKHARHDFPNGYGISVLTGKHAYCDDNTYEVAIMHNGKLCYNTPLTDDVLGYQTKEDINKILAKLEGYEKDQFSE